MSPLTIVPTSHCAHIPLCPIYPRTDVPTYRCVHVLILINPQADVQYTYRCAHRPIIIGLGVTGLVRVIRLRVRKRLVKVMLSLGLGQSQLGLVHGHIGPWATSVRFQCLAQRYVGTVTRRHTEKMTSFYTGFSMLSPVLVVRGHSDVFTSDFQCSVQSQWYVGIVTFLHRIFNARSSASGTWAQ